jgi:integrase
VRERAKQGSICLDKRVDVWNFFWWQDGKRRSRKVGTLKDLPTKTAAWREAKSLRHALENETPVTSSAPNVRTLVEAYRVERMPKRLDTKRSYEVWLKGHILPKWADCCITQLQPRPVQLWLEDLDLSPKSKTLIRGMIGCLWDFAQWRGDVPITRNPMQLVTIKSATKRVRQPRSLTPAEVQKFLEHLSEPFRTLAVVSVCCGLRISEALALKWSDVNWKDGRLQIERGIVAGNVDDVKTEGSRRALYVPSEVLNVLTAWRTVTQFDSDSDWIFAGPATIGRKPWSYDQVWRQYQKAASAAGIGHVPTHSMRHTFRSLLDAVGTPLTVQQRAMRHSSITTTFDHYGDVVTNELAQAGAKVAELALNGMCNGM